MHCPCTIFMSSSLGTAWRLRTSTTESSDQQHQVKFCCSGQAWGWAGTLPKKHQRVNRYFFYSSFLERRVKEGQGKKEQCAGKYTGYKRRSLEFKTNKIPLSVFACIFLQNTGLLRGCMNQMSSCCVLFLPSQFQDILHNKI